MTDTGLSHAAPPQIFSRATVSSIHRGIFLCELPLAAWAVLSYGLPALLTISVALLATLGTSIALTRLAKRPARDVFPLLASGMTLALLLPPSASVFAVALGAAAGLVAAETMFGGRSGQWMSTPVVGVLLVLLLGGAGNSAFLGSNLAGGAWQALPGDSQVPIAEQLVSIRGGAAASTNPAELVRSSGLGAAQVDQAVTSFLNSRLLNPAGANLPGGYFAAFGGLGTELLGNSSLLLVLLCSLPLIERRLVHANVSFWFLGTYSLAILVFAGLPVGQGLGQGNILFHLLFGGPLFCAFFVSADLGTAPWSTRGQIVFGLLLGLLSVALRLGGAGIYAPLFATAALQPLVPIIRGGYRARKAAG